MKDRVATVKGYWAKPGVSLNNRLYTSEHIIAAAQGAQQAIESGESPTVFSMMTHHGARNPEKADVTATAGRLTKVGVDERGWGTFEADLADTQAGRDVAALVTPEKPYLTGVSMASAWNGTPTTKTYEGAAVTTCETGFTLKGIDFTHSPGIPGGAQISSAELAEAAGGPLILESLPEDVFIEAITEARNKTPYGNVRYADPGYQSDGVKRYPIDTADHVRAAWAYINKAKNAGKYSSQQVSRIKGKIKGAAKKFGINIAEEFAMWGREIIEAYTSMSVSNGAGDISVSAYLSDATDLDKAAQVVAMSAMSALATLDPDNDGDLDLDRFDTGDDESDLDENECPNCGFDYEDGAQFCSACGTSIVAGESAPTETEKEGVMPEDKTGTGSEGTPTEGLSDREKELIAEAIKATTAELTKPPEESDELKAARALVAAADEGKTPPAPAAPPPAPPAAESALPKTGEELAALIEAATTKGAAAATEAFKAEMINEIRSNGGPRRRGMVPKNILEQSEEELYGDEGPGWRGVNLRKKGTGELEKIADQVFTPVIATA